MTGEVDEADWRTSPKELLLSGRRGDVARLGLHKDLLSPCGVTRAECPPYHHWLVHIAQLLCLWQFTCKF